MLFVVGFLILVNLFSFYRYKNNKNISDQSLFFELVIDIFALTFQLYLSGGISNPLISLFLLQVVISAILLRFRYAIITTIITICCYAFLGFKYRHIHEFHHHGNAGDFFSLHLQGMFITYVIAAILLLIFIHKIIKNLNERDKQIDQLKHKALEKEQIFRMGLFTTSAAHELGTPLSTISVILGDLKNSAQDELKEDLSMIEKQIQRCKKIISGILLSSKKQRAEKATISSVKDIFESLILEWKDSREVKNLTYKISAEKSDKIIFDNLLEQAFFNIFDNAIEASPEFTSIKVEISESNLIVKVQDQGNGFDKEILNRIGEANLSTKNSSGMGIFLAINALEKINGRLEFSNMTKGAEAKITIPLQKL